MAFKRETGILEFNTVTFKVKCMQKRRAGFWMEERPKKTLGENTLNLPGSRNTKINISGCPEKFIN